MDKIFNILDFGAVADGLTDSTAAIQAALDAADGSFGEVIIPRGKFLSGTISLGGEMTLRIEEGGELICILDKEKQKSFKELRGDDDLSGWDGSHGGCFLFAKDKKNLIICGEGTILGGGEKVFFDDNADGDFHECPLNCDSFRPRFGLFENIENLTIRDITVKNAALWTIHMAGCRNTLVEGVRVLNDPRSPNTDGIDADCCQGMIIRNCLVKTGDDAIVVKTTKPMSALYGECRDILIENCDLSSRDSAIKIGTETWADVRNVTARDCVIRDCSRGIGLWVRDGGTVENISVENISGNTLKYADGERPNHFAERWWGNGEPIFLNATYRKGSNSFPGIIRNIRMKNITIDAETSLFIGGEEETVISDIQLENINITLKPQGTQKPGFFDEQPSDRHVYPHQIPVVYTRYARDVKISGSVKYEAPYNNEENPISILDFSENVTVNMKQI